MYIISDEIHADFAFKGNKFIPYGSLDNDYTQMSISLLSPAKSFNLPSISTSFLYSENEEVFEKFSKFMQSMHLDHNSALDVVAMQTAYNTGDQWLDKLLVHVEGTVNYIESYLKENVPQLKVTKSEGMYLVWLDFRELDIDAKEVNDLLIEEGIALNPGHLGKMKLAS